MFDLPGEIIEVISTYLNFVDLKLLSQTCRYLDEVSGKRLAKTSKLHLWRILTYVEVEMFTNSRRNYENVELDVSHFPYVEKMLKQVESIPSISFHNIILSANCKDKWLKDLVLIFKQYNLKLKNLCMNFPLDGTNSEEVAETIYSSFPQSTFTFKICVSPLPSTKIEFDDINRTFRPIEINFNRNIQHLQFHQDIYNVKHLTLNCNPECDLKYFKRLESLYIYETMKLTFAKNLIENNKQTLTNLRLFSSFEETWNFELPCQLSQFVCVHHDIPESTISTDILRNQRYLRYVFLYSNELNNDLLHTLSENKFLSALDLKYCCLDKYVDIRKFEFLKNVSEICFVEGDLTDFTIMKAILEYADKVNWLHFEVASFPEHYDFKVDDMTIKILNSLKILKVDGVEISKYFSRRLKAPNLEVCDIDCFPNFLFDCKHVRTLNVGIEIVYEEVVNILESLQSLETFHFKLKSGNFENSFKYILLNIRGIRHFRLDIFSENSVYNPDIRSVIESTLKSFDFHWRKLEELYFTEQFSFEVYDF